MLWERTGRQAPTSLRRTVAWGDETLMNSQETCGGPLKKMVWSYVASAPSTVLELQKCRVGWPNLFSPPY